MGRDGDPGETLVLRGDPLALLESSPIFRGLDRPTLAAISAELESLSLPGGATLFEAGEASDAMYLLIAGCLGAYAAGDSARLLGRITAGETVGEMGLVSGHPRSATIRALRDSDLVRLPRHDHPLPPPARPPARRDVTELM